MALVIFRGASAQCIFSFLLNGSADNIFKSSWGLRQWDPLVPLNLVMAVEVLSQLFLQAQRAGEFFSFEITKAGTRLPL